MTLFDSVSLQMCFMHSCMSIKRLLMAYALLNFGAHYYDFVQV